VRTVVTANTREPVVEDTTGEELVGHLRDHGAPRAVLAREALVVDGLQAMQMVRDQPKASGSCCLAPSANNDISTARCSRCHMRAGRPRGDKRCDPSGARVAA